MLLGLEGQTRKIEQSGVEIVTDYRLGDRTATLGKARVIHDQGYSYSSLIDPCLARFVGQDGGNRTLAAYGGKPAIVGKEEQDGIVPQVQAVEGGEHPANVFIEAFHHRGIGGVILAGIRKALMNRDTWSPFLIQPHCFGFFLIFFQFLRLGSEGCVHGVKPEIQKERAVLFLFDKMNRMVGKDIGQVIARLAVLQSGNIGAWMLLTFVGKKKGSGLAHFMACDIEIEPMVFRVVPGALLMVCLQVPFAHMSGGVAMLFKGFRQGEIFSRHIPFYCGWFKYVLGTTGTGTAAMVGQPDPAGIFAGKHAGTGGGADRVGGVGIVKEGSSFGQGIEVGGLVKGAAG